MAIAQTAQSQFQAAATQTQAVDFYFDPSCPWAWRTSLWIREVEKVRPIQVTWKFLSLAKINEASDYARDSHAASHATFPLLARARERFGNDAVDRLYLALGRARHERKESLADPAVIERALTEAGLDPAWRTEAAAEPGMEERILAEHQDGVERVGAFGVPMISLNRRRGFFGPVITSVPTSEDAGELWDHLAWLAARDDFFLCPRAQPESRREWRRVPIRICSFLPSATEIVYALGLQDQLYGVTFECDYPADARNKPKVVRSLFENIASPLSSGEISQIIRQRLQEGLGIYEVNLEALQAAEPDVLLSQAICEVCAISSRQVMECSLRLAKTPQLLSLDPQYVGDVLNDIRRVAAATGTVARGEEIVAGLQARIAAVAERAAQATTRPRVLHLEWAEPVMCGGHWVPEMIDMAGGVNCFGDKDTGSFRLEWDAVVESQPEMIILMLCGYTVQRALEDLPILAAKPGWDDLPAVRHHQIFAIDAGAYTSRSGPRLVQGLEIIAESLHPELFSGSIPADGAARVDSTLARIG